MSISDATSLSAEIATEVGLGLGDVILSATAAWFCSKGVSFLGNKTQEAVRTHWKTMWTIISSPEIKFRVIPQKVIPEEQVLAAIQTCTSSSNRAAVSVGTLETLVQCYHLATKDNRKPWSINVLEGGYRGAAIGALAGLTKESDHLLEKIINTATAALVGCVLGQTLAVIGHIARSLLNQDKNEPACYNTPVKNGVIYEH